MAGKISELATEKLKGVIESLGYELVEVEYQKKVDGMNLTFVIDKTGGVNLDDCEKVHRTIDPILDELDPTNNASYVLNVSSVGLDRPIKTDADLKRNLNKEIEITLYKKLEKTKNFTGVLTSFSQDKVVISAEGKEIEFLRKDVAHMVLHIEF